MPKLTVGSLFAGVGGIELGLEMTGGFETVWQCENDSYATRVLEKHWPAVRRWRDVATFPPDANGDSVRDGQQLSGEQGAPSSQSSQSKHDGSPWHVDLICGGFPCQPVSSAGKRWGEDDDRWLWDEMRRVCAILRPAWVLAENVPGLLSARDVQGRRGALFGRILRDLAALGYRVRWDCVPAAAVGAPHIRDRVFIVGHAAGTPTGAEPKGGRPRDTVGKSGGGYDPNAVCRHCGHGYDDCICILPGPFGSVDVSDAKCDGRQQSPEVFCRRQPESSDGCQDVPDSLRSECESGAGRRGVRQGDTEVGNTISDGRYEGGRPQTLPEKGRRERFNNGCWWSTQCRLGIHPDGLSSGLDGCGGWECGIPRTIRGQKNRVDRLRCLGNAVVPQVAEFIGQRILEAEN